MNSDEVSEGLKVHPIARWAAVVPVVVIAAGFIAFMLGYRLEGRRYEVLDWRTHAVAENNFTVATPGMFIVQPEVMQFNGEDAVARIYDASDRGVSFAVVAVRRPDADTRPPAEVADSLGLDGAVSVQRADGLAMFQHDTTRGPNRIETQVIFHDRMMYRLTARAPAASFPAADAARFFGSFRLLDK